MKLYKRPLCWVARHKWVLKACVPTALYEEDDTVAESEYYYLCQRCGKLQIQCIVHLKGEIRSIYE